MLSGLSSEQETQRGYRSGVDEWMIKGAPSQQTLPPETTSDALRSANAGNVPLKVLAEKMDALRSTFA